MAELIDRLGFYKSDMFKLLREKSCITNMQTSDLIDYKDGMLYFWFSEEDVLLVSKLSLKPENIASNGEVIGHDKYQTLKPAGTPMPDIKKILLNNRASQIAAVGTYGVNIFDLPNRWGPEGTFTGGVPEIIMRCRLLSLHGARRILSQPLQHTVLRVRWYPGSVLDPYLAILYSDNRLRFFDTVSFSILQCVKLGPEPHRCLTIVGDNVVDYDFAPLVAQEEFKNINTPVPKNVLSPGTNRLRRTVNQMEWAVYFMRSNGDVFKVVIDLASTKSNSLFPVEGPLRMHPADDNNYGIDGTAMLILNCLPPIFVLSRSNGILYHCVLLPNLPGQTTESDEEVVIADGIKPTPPECALYVFECVEPELGLNVSQNVDLYTSPVHLKRDSTSNTRYLCSHDSGLHLVRLPIVSVLESFVEAKGEDESRHLLSCMTQLSSSVQYIVCTNIKKQSDIVLPLRGAHILSLPVPDTLIAILGDGQVVSVLISTVQLTHDFQLEIEQFPKLDGDHEQFFNFIIKILDGAEAKKQPILMLGSDPSLQDTHNLITRALAMFRNDAFHSQKKALEEIEGRVKMLNLLKVRQEEDLKTVILEKEKLQMSAEKLAEKYKEISAKQQELCKRSENLLLRVHSLSVITSEEKQMDAVLKEKDVSVTNIVKSVEDMRQKLTGFKEQMQQMDLESERIAISMNNNQSNCIRNSLARMKIKVGDLVERVKSAKQRATTELQMKPFE